MKAIIFYIILLFSFNYSQIVDPTLAPVKNDSIQTIQKINELEYYINFSALNPNWRFPSITDRYKKEIDSKIELSSSGSQYSKLISVQILNIVNNGDQIIAERKIIIYNDSQIFDSFLEKIILKREGSLSFNDFGKLESLFLTKYSQFKSNERIDKLVIENQQLFLSNNSFISKHAIQNPLTYQLDLNLSLNQFQKKLFASGEAIDNTYFSDGTKETAFYMDQTWKRILFSQSSSSQLNILSYGDNSADYHFGIPRSIDVNEWGELYIADSEKGIVNKLYYSWITNTITATSNVNFLQALIKPVDAD